MTMTDELTFTVGDRVTISHEYAPTRLRGRVFIVERVNPKNVIARPEGGGKGINYPKYTLEKVVGEAHGAVTVTEVPILTLHDPGSIVTLKQTPNGEKDNQPYIVIKDDGGERVNVTRLGGNEGRYWRVPRRGVEARDIEWLKSVL